MLRKDKKQIQIHRTALRDRHSNIRLIISAYILHPINIDRIDSHNATNISLGDIHNVLYFVLFRNKYHKLAAQNSINAKTEISIKTQSPSVHIA